MIELKKILYIEDDQSIAEVVTMTLEMMGGFEVQHCDSGQKALDAFEDSQAQLILVDMMMPGMDGLETIERIRKLPKGDSIPVVFMTAKAQMDEQKAYIDSGALGVIVKPFEPVKLCERVKELWEKENV